jgi:hypothetical protein
MFSSSIHDNRLPASCRVACMAAFVIVTAVLSAPARAQDLVDPIYYGMFGIGGEATYLNFDVTNGFATAIGSAGGAFIRQAEGGTDFDDIGGGGNMHVLVPLNDGPLGIDAFHLVFGGDAASSDGDSGTIQIGPGEFLHLLPIDGGIVPAAINLPGTTTYDSVTDFYRIYGAPTLGWNQGSLTLKVGPLVEFKTYDLDVDFTNITGLGAPGFETLDETVDVWSAGPMLAAIMSVPLGSHFSGFLGGQGAALWASGHLDAHQHLNFANGFATLSRDQSDSADDLAFMGRGVAGVSVTAGRVVGSLYGAAEWRNDMYEIVNPRSGPGMNAFTTSFSPAHLEQTGMWSLSIGLKGSIKLGGR